nr:hypothetical protein [uncultured Rhodopila sp.]
MAPETIRECLLRQAGDLRTRGAQHLAHLTAIYLEYEADRLDGTGDQPCDSHVRCKSGVWRCLARRPALAI